MPKIGALSAGSRVSLVSVGLMPVIAEDENPERPALAVPQRSYRRSLPADFSTSPPYPPPRYSKSKESIASEASANNVPDRTPPSTGTKERLKDAEWVARRGGWYRLGLIAFFVTALIVGLSVGLTVGMRKNNTTVEATPLPTHFPAGSFAFQTALSNISTSCTNNPSAWRCYPYTTYDQSPSSSTATFFWIISPVNLYDYAISSTENPFAPQFVNISMALLDPNQYGERLTFNFTMDRTVVPSAQISANPGIATCRFPSTLFRATLWTRKGPQFPRNATAEGTVQFGNWPGQVEVEQIVKGGAGVPTCMDVGGARVGDFEVDDGAACRCRYANYGFPGGTTRRKLRR